MRILFYLVPILFSLVSIAYLIYFCKKKKNARGNPYEIAWIESLDLSKWRGGVRRRMELIRDKDHFYRIKKDIRFP